MRFGVRLPEIITVLLSSPCWRRDCTWGSAVHESFWFCLICFVDLCPTLLLLFDYYPHQIPSHWGRGVAAVIRESKVSLPRWPSLHTVQSNVWQVRLHLDVQLGVSKMHSWAAFLPPANRPPQITIDSGWGCLHAAIIMLFTHDKVYPTCECYTLKQIG